METLVCYKNLFKIMKDLNKFFSILYINFTYNNIICTLTTYKGNTLIWSTTGSKKTKGLKKITTASINSLINCLYKNYLKNSKSICIKIKGYNKNKNLFIKKLKVLGFKILFIQENLNIPYNGCKKKRKRKI